MSFFGEIYADPDLPHRARTVYMYLRDAERQERFPQSFMGVHAAETHKERVICKIACNIALERPLGEIGALLCGVSGDVNPRIYSQPRPVSTPKADDYMRSYGDK